MWRDCEETATPPSTSRRRSEGPTWGDDGSFFAKYFDLKTDDPPEKVVDWYKTKLPSAKVRKETDYTCVTWSDFAGAEKGEYISITARPKEIHISECLKSGKHKKH